MNIKITKADRDWGKAIRERDGGKCQWPQGCTYNYTQVQAHHIFPRARRATRHELENGISLCPHHHTLGGVSAHREPEMFRRMMKIRLGKNFIKLQDKSLGVIR